MIKVQFKLTDFETIGIEKRISDSLKKMNFINPTEVQEIAIPLILEGKDITVRSKTGTGKTGAFLIPVIQKIAGKKSLSVLVLVPTRELAKQVADVARKISGDLGIKTVTVYGGASINVQVDNLRNGPNIVVGTPGRILDLIERHALDLSKIEFLILDEADVMLDMGFIEDVNRIISMSKPERQTMLFSATMPREIVNIAKSHMKKDRKNIIVGEEEERTVETISHYYSFSSRNQKFNILVSYIERYQPKKAIIFTNTKEYANRIFNAMRNLGMDVLLLHGGLTQAEREKSLRNFRQNGRFLIATNVASRGLDIPDITDIINFDAPDDPNSYIHRVGRTARMGKDGRAYTLLSDSEEFLVDEIMDRANITMEEIGLFPADVPELSRFRNSRGTSGQNTDRNSSRRNYSGNPRYKGPRGNNSGRRRGVSGYSR